MSNGGVTPPPASTTGPPPSAGPTGAGPTSAGGTGTTTSAISTKDPLRGSRASGIWAAVVALVVLLVLLAVFILQNTRQVEVTYFGWTGQAPLAAALLIATAIGLLIAVAAGSLRILQLRHRVRREQRR